MSQSVRVVQMVSVGLVVLLLAGGASSVSAQESATTQAKPAQTPPPAVSPTPAEPKATAPAGYDLDKIVNVKFEVTLTYSRGGITTTRLATVTVAADGNAASFRSGTDIPVPSTTFTPVQKADGSVQTPLTSYQYRPIGFNVDVERVRWGGHARVMANVKVDSSDVDMRTGKPPTYPTFRQTFSLVLESGKPLEVVKSRDVVDGVETIQTIEIKATILS